MKPFACIFFDAEVREYFPCTVPDLRGKVCNHTDPKMATRWPQNKPNMDLMWTQNGFKTAPKMAPSGPKKPTEAPRWSKGGPELAPGSPKIARNGRKMARTFGTATS